MICVVLGEWGFKKRNMILHGINHKGFVNFVESKGSLTQFCPRL